jgi:magnesium chelatase subunit D
LTRADSREFAGADAASTASRLADAWLAAQLFTIDAALIGGIVVQAGAGPVRDRWLADLRALQSPAVPWRAVPLHVDLDRLIGGIDLAATLQLGRPAAQRGLLAEADGGVVVVAMAERASASTAAHLAAVLDAGEVACARHGIETRLPARFGIVALDEGDVDDERASAALRDRLAFHIDLRDVSWRDLAALPQAASRDEVAAAAGRLPEVEVDDAIVDALCSAASALGIASIRASLLAVRVARLAAAFAGRVAVDGEDAALAARLVLAPRATRLPAAGEETVDSRDEESTEAEPESEPDDDLEPDRDDDSGSDEDAGDPNAEDPSSEPLEASLDEIVLAAAAAAIPAGLLARLQTGTGTATRGASGRAGALRARGRRGRPTGVRRARPHGGARLDLIATLRAAAPWQRVRGREAGTADGAGPGPVRVRSEDFHVSRFQERARTTTIFAVDASGSSALHRLAEAKGAVELLLADCYVRRDSVAVFGFRGRTCELLLAPTRSLARAKRSLAELVGGGGTPLALGIDAACTLAVEVRRRGDTPVIVVLSDGRANVARDGSPGREHAEADARSAARRLRDEGLTALFIDTSPQPYPLAREIAATMHAEYLPLPHAEAATLSQAVRAAVAPRDHWR